MKYFWAAIGILAFLFQISRSDDPDRLPTKCESKNFF